MKNVVTRALAGAVYVGIIIASLLLQDIWFMLLLIFMAGSGIYELEKMAPAESALPQRVVYWDILCGAVIVSMSMIAAQALAQHEAPKFVVTLVGPVLFWLIVRGLLQIYCRNGNPIMGFSQSMCSMVYVAGALATLPYIYYLFGSAKMILGIFIMIWMNDTGAYIVGCTIGKHRLCERLSPKKSWEGFWGGFIFAIGVAAALKGIWPGWFGDMSMLETLGLGAVVSVFGTWGDLFESMLKRSSGVKDSGHLIPGHGGILDRIDSLLFVAPASLLYLIILAQ